MTTPILTPEQIEIIADDTQEHIAITYGTADTVVMSWDGAQASAPIRLDGQSTQYQTADARHRTADAVRLMCEIAWGPVVEDAADAKGGDSWETVWDDVEYAPVEAERSRAVSSAAEE